jgi:hypothetical protein
MDNIRIYSFENFRLGDKIAACYQLQYYAINKGYHYILVDPTADSYFSIRRYFPSIGQYCIETNTAHEIYEELKKHYQEIGFHNLWISSPSLFKDTGFVSNMILPDNLKQFQHELYDKKSSKKLIDYKIKIVNHVLLDAPYNKGRNHTLDQWDRLMTRVQEYIDNNEIDAIIIDIPIDYSWSVESILCLIEMGDIYVGGDTGFSHCFSAFNPNKPLIAIYGSDDHDKQAFEYIREEHNYSSQWSSLPISNNLYEFRMKNNLFNEEEVFEEIINQIKLQNENNTNLSTTL